MGELGSMIVDVAGNGQPPAFNSIGHDGDRAVLHFGGNGKGLENLGYIVSPQIHEQLFQDRIIHVGQQPGHIGSDSSTPFQHSTANFLAIRVEQALVLGIATVVNPLPQPVTMWTLKEGALLAAVFEPQHLPTLGLEQARDLLHLSLWRDVIQALAIDIHNPPQIAQAIRTRLSQGFWDIALIDLGVTNQGDVAAWHSMPEVITDIV